jgi:beta-lactam-binding protein with PASTA domain
VTLTITDSSGQTASVAHTVVIGGPNACLVPALIGRRFASAKQQLTAAQCSLGRADQPAKPSHRPGKGKRWRLIVLKQTPAAQSVKHHGTAVSLTLAWFALT